MTNHLLLDTQNGIAVLTLNRPEIHNAFDDILIGDLTAQLQQLDADSSVRVVLLAANGKSFSAGADINWMRRMATYSPEENLQDALALARLMNTLYTLSKPTIALVQGAAYGGGVGLVACCDIALAVSRASFCLSEVKLGLIAAAIGPYVLAALGERAARRYFLTAEKFSAQEAYRLGLAHEIVAEEELIKHGRQMAENILANGPQALTAAKKFIRAIAHKPMNETVLQFSAETIARLRSGSEAQEGLSAFLEKRKPTWAPDL
jgi:methylglutaconyl-CoA hydratase